MKKILLAFLALAGSTVAMAQWSDNSEENNRLTPTQMEVYDVDIQAASNGKTYVVFNKPAENIVTCIQIIEKDGKMLFPEEGKVISDEFTRSWTMINDQLMVDRDDNMLIMVSDCRNSNEELKKISYSIYKISPTGEMLWGDKGIDLEQGYSYDYGAGIKAVQLEDGSYVLAWMRKNGETDLFSIQMQRLSSEGEILWDENVVLSEPSVEYKYPYLVNAGNNQVNLVYLKGANQDIMVRKIDFDGSSVWPQDTRVYRGGFSGVPAHVLVSTFPGPDGGVIISWYDDRAFTNKESSFISYVKANGTLGFNSGEEGQQISYSELRSFRPEVYYDKTENCIYTVCRETSSNQDYQRIVGQKIAMTGELLWGPEGLDIYPLSDVFVGYYAIKPATDGQIAAFYMVQHADGYGDVQAYAMRIDKDGNRVWGEEPLIFASSHSEKNGLIVTNSHNDSYWVALWKDERKFDENDKTVGKLYYQRVNLDGTIGAAASVESVKSEPGLLYMPTLLEGNAEIMINNEKAGMVDLSIYSLSGQKVAVIYNGNMEKGYSEISWDAKSGNVASGIYIATLTTTTGTKSMRVLVK